MTIEEAIEYNKNLREYMRITDKDSEYKFLKENYEALDMAIKALEQEPITWIIGKNNCQFAVKNMPIDKIQKICAIIGEETQQLCEDMRDATEEERKSTKDYIDSISKPTGLQFDDMYEELDFAQSHKKLSANLQPCEDCISREDAINELKLAYFNKDLQSAKGDPCIIDAMTDWAIRTIKKLPSVTPKVESEEKE